MTDWIGNLKDEDNRKAQKEHERDLILNQSRSIIGTLRKLAEQSAEEVNNQLFDGKARVKVVNKPDWGNPERSNDFCVSIDSLPTRGNRKPDEKYNFAYLYVKYSYEKVCITRALEIFENSATNEEDSRIRSLTPLQLSPNENGFPFIHMEGQLLNQDEIARELVEPVVKAHRGELKA